MLSFNVSVCKQSGPYELLSTVRLTAAGKRITRCLFNEWKRARDMPSCSHSCRALALERAKAHIVITAARYTRQETLPALVTLLPDLLTRLQRLSLSPQAPHPRTSSTEPLYGGLLYGGTSVYLKGSSYFT